MSGRSVSSAVAAKLSGPAYSPGFLVQMNLSSILRFSTRGDISWNGSIFIRTVLDVTGLEDDSAAGQLTFDDPTLAVQSLVRTESLVGKRVQIARFYEGALATADPIWFFDGAVDSAYEDRRPRVIVTVSRIAANRSMTPPRRVSRATGFTVMQPEGRRITFRGSSFLLARARL